MLLLNGNIDEVFAKLIPAILSLSLGLTSLMASFQ